MDNEMIDRCVKAHYDSYFKIFELADFQFENQSDKVKKALKDAMIETIKAMREPTDAMISNTDPIDPAEAQWAKECWHAMIDAVIND